MNGRYYGVEMIVAPTQKNSGLLILVEIYGLGKLGVLTVFPKLFKGYIIKNIVLFVMEKQLKLVFIVQQFYKSMEKSLVMQVITKLI
jgi:hypothetical protein